MRLPPFTLVYRPGLRAGGRQARARQLAAELGELRTGLSRSLAALKPTIRRSLLETLESSADRAGSADSLSLAVHELQRRDKVKTVGIWDLSLQVGALPRVIEALNRSQPAFAFFEVQAAVPSGLISRPERVVAWAIERFKRPLSPRQLAEIGSNLIFEDFADRAVAVRRELGLDHLIGIVPSMIAFEEGGKVFWNYFSLSKEPRLAVASTFDVFRFARRAGRPFEVAVASIALSTLLAILNPSLEFHEDLRGCLFDFNRERDTIVASLQRMEIETCCLARIRPTYRDAAEAMVTALRDLGTSPSAPVAGQRKPAAPRKGMSSKKRLARPRARAARSMP
jgi:hypothetical protein